MVDALASGLPLAAEHVQVLERLRQLTAWQQAQQERLKQHQQEQIALLRAEHDASRGQPVPGLSVADLSPRAQLLSLEPRAPSPSLLYLDYPTAATTTTTTIPTPSRDTDLASPQEQQVALAECKVLVAEQCEDPLSSEVTLREEALSDSGLDTGEQGSEEETQQREQIDDLTGGWEPEDVGHLQSGDRPIKPGVGV